ncbi:MAG: ribosomal protein S18-alanine N-acetyltransferase [Clostridia bacterium]|nr:ribosomal protein S18-alanine N-acetyltransferase [Loktanella sp.]MBQ1951045.1 ribosomal protein S18-alanine N-acetyltransferase [Clostridia bacterium]
MEIRPMVSAHVPALAELEKQCFSTPWSAAALAEELENPHAVFLVACDAHTVYGYIGMHHLGDEGFITNVAVSPDARRQGIGKSLLAAAAAYGQTHALYRLTLEVRVSNAAAIALYETCGWVRDGTRPGFYRAPTEDAAIYSLYF